MAIDPKYQRLKTGAGELRTPVFFYEYKPGDGLEPEDIEEKELHRSMAEVYNPSMKDWELLDTKNTKRAVTINIRDPLDEYQPTNKHVVEIQDFHFMKNDKEFLRWNVVDVQPSPRDSRLIKIILAVTS
ncbi:phage head-tail adapter protein [Enterococcus asini]|uniref:phage head-tail adapter protein n=1 Tax=Enterococcus asini TaxID=57732 RepID=UPI0022E98EA4|nr:phage head-tail adapter protein [Enterococcus asini]